MNRILGSTLALALVAGSASAAVVTVGGGYSYGPQGSTGPLAVNGVSGMNFEVGSGNNSLRGTINAANVSTGGVQNLTLVLTNLVFSSDAAGPITVTVNIVQDYVVEAGVLGATGSHQLNGNTVFVSQAQSGRVSSVSTHENTALPDIDTGVKTGVGVVPFQVGQGPTTNVVTDSIYRINTTYTFVLNAAGAGLAQIILPDSGVDNATLVLVPLPPAAFAGIGGLALVGATGAIRRRKMSK